MESMGKLGGKDCVGGWKGLPNPERRFIINLDNIQE